MPKGNGAENPGIDVLVVCTGNFTRSPFIAWDLRRRVGSPLRVASAGTQAVPARLGCDPRVVSALQKSGTGARALRHHRAQPVSANLLESSALVITATREHRGQLNLIAPSAGDRIFTLLELARLLDGRAPRDLGIADLGPSLASARGGSLVSDESTDLPDPLGKPTKYYLAMIDTVDAALDVIAPHITAGVVECRRGA